MTEYVPVFKLRNPLTLMPHEGQADSRGNSAPKSKKPRAITATKLPKISANAPILTNAKGQEAYSKQLNTQYLQEQSIKNSQSRSIHFAY